MQPRAQALVDPESTHRVGQLGQSRCPSHVELVPRRAVRKVGPRPDRPVAPTLVNRRPDGLAG
jgi:hypothetical protein